MYNTMNGVSATDKLGLGPEVRQLKFGSSFTGNNKGQGGSFHTIRYDFKPASVDTTKMATVDVGPNSQVTITVPHSDGAGTNVFKGPRKPYTKDCVLIIDQETGQVVLEKLTHNIQVKKTRQERPEGGNRMSKGMPPAPAPPPEVKKPPQPKSHHKQESKPSKFNSSSSSQQMSQSNAIRRTPNSPMTSGSSVPARHSPLGPSPNRHSPPQANSNSTAVFDSLVSKKSSLPSLNSIEDLLATAPPPPARNIPIPSVTISTPTSQTKPPTKDLPVVSTALSESSSGDDSSSSSSSDASDSSDEEMEVVPDEVPIKNKSMSPQISMPTLTGPGLSMPPRPHASALLSDDLQLSESGSESD